MDLSGTPTHKRISPTAKLVAYLRTFTDIPYSSEIALASDAQQTFEELVGGASQDFLWLAPVIEMRYKSVDAILKLYGFQNIMELASGVSPRGLIWSKSDTCTFLETDLPDILAEKRFIVSDILGGSVRKGLRLMPVNVVCDDQIRDAAGVLGDGPMAIVNEGLLPYLSITEKAKVACSIHGLLKERGGVWVTPDISSNERIKQLIALDPKVGEVMRVISGRTGRDLQNNAFTSMAAAEEFFVDIGFNLKRWHQHDLVPHLTAFDRVEVDQRKLDVMINHSKVWVLEAR